MQINNLWQNFVNSWQIYRHDKTVRENGCKR